MIRFLQALLSSQPVKARTDWFNAHHLGTDETRWLAEQGLAPYVFYRLRQLELLSRLPGESRSLLQRAFYAGAIREALQHQEATGRVLAALGQAGVETVLMKGMALAHTVYPSPRCRLMGDLDLWIHSEQREKAIGILEGVGYRAQHKDERPPELGLLYEGEQQMVNEWFKGGMVELQWPAIRGEYVRHATRVDHEGIWARRCPFMLGGTQTNIMALEDILIHLCIHLAVNHRFSDPWLRALLDVHLVVQQGVDWSAVVSRARAWRVATIVWMVLTLSERLLGTPIADIALDALSPTGCRRYALAKLQLERALTDMWSVEYHHRRFVTQLLLLDQPLAAIRLLWRSLFPETEWLKARYGTRSAGELWRARLFHPMRLLVTAKA